MKRFVIAIAVLGWPLAQARADGGPDAVLPPDQVPLTAPSPPPEYNAAANNGSKRRRYRRQSRGQRRVGQRHPGRNCLGFLRQ